MLISSRPSFPQTTKARSTPSSRSTSAKVSPSSFFATPSNILDGVAGLMSGPSTLKMVRKASDRRIGAM